MAKATGGHYKHPNRAQWASVQLPADAGVQRLLTGTGTRHEHRFSEMSSHADPGRTAQRAVTFPAEERGALAEELAALLRRAREAGDPAADALAAFAVQLGVREPERGPDPAA